MDSSGSRESPFPRKVAGFADLTNHSAFRVTAGRISRAESGWSHELRITEKPSGMTSSRRADYAHDETPCPSAQEKRGKKSLSSRFCCSSPRFTGRETRHGAGTPRFRSGPVRENSRLLPFRTREIDDVSRRPKTRRGAPADSFLASFDPCLNQNVSTDDFSSVRSQVPARWRLSASSSSITLPPFSA